MHHDLPVAQTDIHHARPLYEYLPGWDQDISDARSFGDLPPNAQSYVRAIEELSRARISVIGVGAGRDAIVQRHAII